MPSPKLHRLQFALPTRYKSSPLEGPHYVEPLLGGTRSVLVFSGDQASALSMLGRSIVNAYPVLDEIIASDLVENVVIDGEFTTSDPDKLGELTADPKKLDDTFGLLFHAYDIMTVDQWEARICEMPLHYRKSLLATLILQGEYKRTLFSPTTFVSNEAERLRSHAKNKAQGLAGSVYKDIESPYPFGHTLDWWADRT